jgi:hypothetical protein
LDQKFQSEDSFQSINKKYQNLKKTYDEVEKSKDKYKQLVKEL